MKEVSTLKVKPALKQKRDRSNQPLIAFVVAAICYLFMLLISQKYPFGDKDFLISDLDAQYAPFLFFYKNHIISALKGGHIINALTYSFGLGMGRNFMSTFGYYLSSPFNILIMLFDNTHVNELVMLLVGIRLSLSAAFMTMLLRIRSSNKESKMHVLFALVYTFSSYIMVFMFQIMWLDGYMLLPLLLYFIEKYLKTGKVKGIAVVLLFMFWSNYYIAYMAGIFSFFYLLERMYVTDEFSVVKTGMKKIGKFILTAGFSAMTIGFMIIPVGLDTLGAADVTQSMADPNLVNFRTIDIVDQAFLGYPGEFIDILSDNLPLVFMSLMVTLLCIIYFVSPVFKGKERKARVAGFLFAYISLALTFVDIAWQVFDSPNWFNHRQSFVFMPLYLLTAFSAFERIKEVDNRDIKKSAGIALLFILIAQSFGAMAELDSVFLVNIIGIIAFALIFAGMKKTNWHPQLRNMNKLLPVILSIVVVFEICGIAPVMSAGVSTLSVYSGSGSQRVTRLNALNEFTSAAKKLDHGFRSENVIHGVGINNNIDNAAYYCGYNGMGFFNSNSNKPLHHFLKQLGFETNYNYFMTGYSFEAPDTDAFLSIGTFWNMTDYSYGTYVADDSYDMDYSFYINRNVLPLAFSVDSGAFDFDFYTLEKQGQDKDYLMFRNDWYASMFSDEFTEDFYTPLTNEPTEEVINGQKFNIYDYVTPIDNDSSESAESSKESALDPDKLGNESLEINKNSFAYYRNNDKAPMFINYEFESESEQELYLNVSFPRISTGVVDVFVNSQYISDYNKGSFYSFVVRLGSFPVGEKIRVTLVCESDGIELQDVNFAYMNNDVFQEQFSTIDTSDVTVEQAQNGYVKLSSDLKGDDMILTTVPYEKGWKLYIDGTEQEISVYQDALIGINAGPGHHEIELVFECPGLKLGAMVSVIGVLGFIGMAVYTKKKQIKTTNK